MKLVDTHQHFWNLDQFPYSWCKGIPSLNRSFLLKDYLEAMKGTGIVKTVFMECDVDEPHSLDEVRHVQSLAEKHPLISGMVASARPEGKEFPRQLECLVQLPKVRGIRRVLHTQPDELSRSGCFAENIRLIARHRLTFDLCVLARQLPIAVELVKKCPEVSFVLDHCGVPDVQGRGLDPWRAHIKELSGLPNVVCKISGLVAYADPEKWKVKDLRPFVDHVLACFGWDRVVWGGDWPVCTLSATLKQWVDAMLEFTLNASESEREKLFWRNAERIYRV